MIRLTTLLLFLTSFASANEISKINKLKKNAEIAYKAGQYDVAVSNYSYLIDTLHIDDEQATINLGHAYYQLGKKDLAQAQYQKLALSKDQELKSVAYQQLGALSNDPKTLEKALSYFKESIKSDPSNQDARYNYELVKKKLKDQNQNQDQNQDENQDNENQENKDEEKKDQDNKDNEDQQKGDQNEDQQQEDSENQDQQEQDQQKQDQKGEENKEDQQGQEDEKKDGEEQQQEQSKPEEGKDGEKDQKEPQQAPSPSDKMQEMNISEEKAKMILEALKNSEVQYIQQNRRKPTKRKDSDKPDW